MGDVCCLPLILFFLLFFYFFFFFLLFCGAQTPTSVDTPSAPWTVDTYIDTYGAGTSRPPFLRGHYTSSGQRVFPAVWCFRVLWTDGSVQQLASPSIVRGKRRGGGGGGRLWLRSWARSCPSIWRPAWGARVIGGAGPHRGRRRLDDSHRARSPGRRFGESLRPSLSDVGLIRAPSECATVPQREDAGGKDTTGGGGGGGGGEASCTIGEEAAAARECRDSMAPSAEATTRRTAPAGIRASVFDVFLRSPARTFAHGTRRIGRCRGGGGFFFLQFFSFARKRIDHRPIRPGRATMGLAGHQHHRRSHARGGSGGGWRVAGGGWRVIKEERTTPVREVRAQGCGEQSRGTTHARGAARRCAKTQDRRC